MRRCKMILVFLLFFVICSANKSILWEHKKVIDIEFSHDSTLLFAAFEKTLSAYNIKTKLVVNTINLEAAIIKFDLEKNLSKVAVSLVDTTIDIINTSNSSLLFKIRDLHSIVNTLKFTNDGKYLLAGLQDGQLIVIDCITGSTIRNIPAHKGEVTGIEICDTLKIIATCGSDGFVCIWDLSGFSLLDKKQVHNDWIRDMVFKTDGSVLYTCGDDGKIFTCYMYGKTIHTIECISSKLFSIWLLSIDFKGPNAIVVSNLSGKIEIFINNSIAYIYKVNSRVYGLKFYINKDAYLIVAVATDNGVQILDAKDFSSRF